MKITTFRQIPRSVFALGVVSLLTDMSSEMIYPLLPLFLTGVLGASVLSLGFIEGAAEATASLLKVLSGVWTDHAARRKPFVLAGYGISGVARPLIGFAAGWPFVLAMRLADRAGKGIRGSPRDALIADVTPAALRGRAFGFHRMMDHAGAVAGPLIAMALITGLDLPLRTVFLLAALPGVAVILVIIFLVREPAPVEKAAREEVPFRLSLRGFDSSFKWLLGCLLLFTLGCSSDAFILLRLSEAGVDAAWIAGLWALHHAVKMSASYLGGILSDRWGRRRAVTAAWLLYAGVYFSFAAFESLYALVAIFLLYGLYFGLAEPSERAWVADLAPERLRGTAMGLYHGVVGIAAMPASLLFGALWHFFGAGAAFATGGACALAACALLMFTTAPQGAQPG